MNIQLTVNGSEESLDVSPNLSLLNMLRENLALTGTKSGCEAGECGACTVLLNGEPVNSCMVLAVECSGSIVDTIEGLSEQAPMQKLQDAFMELNAIQCGFCTPGMLISAYALLKRNPDPSDEEIRMALLGNLCRCTGYERIINAVKKVARKRERSNG
ncbi:MAG: (2Fe-2S)-binding protein [Deltaproteobacteria bacterium]